MERHLLRQFGGMTAGVQPVARATDQAHDHGGSSGGFEHLLNGKDETLELGALGAEPFLAGRGQRVVAGAAIVLRRAPLGFHPSVQQQPLQRGVERAFADLQHVLRHDLEPVGDAVAMQRPGDERAQDQEVECAREQVRWLIGESHMVTSLSIPNYTTTQLPTSNFQLPTSNYQLTNVHSARSAMRGSTRETWQAGTSPARIASRMSASAAPPSTTGSVVVTP